MIPQIYVDSFVILVMFILRIAIPVALTIAAGRWLEKRLRPPATAEQNEAAQTIRAFNRSDKIIYLHCWDLKRCDPRAREQCPAFQHSDLPCWLALQLDNGKIREACLSCAMYKPQAIAA